MVVGLCGRVAGGAAVVVFGIASVKAVTCGEMVRAEFRDEITTFAHFGVNTTEDVPINCVECAIVPVKAILVVEYESWEASVSANGDLKALGHGNAVDGKHYTDFRVERDVVEGSGIFIQFHSGESIPLGGQVGGLGRRGHCLGDLERV
jgi:hypothetical protein